MKQQVTVSAPGKLMLLGEHAVVYDHPCLVTAVDRRLKAKVTRIDELQLTICATDVGISAYSKPIKELCSGTIPKEVLFIEHSVKRFFEQFGISHGLEITTSSDFSHEFGFGSSSAVTVCMVKALSEIFALKLSNKQIFDISYQTVLDVQKKGSGFDIAAAVYGGTLYFLTGGKTITQLNTDELPLVVGYSGTKADTVTLINNVTEIMKSDPNRINVIYNSIDHLVEEAKEAIIARNWQKTGKFLNANQILLAQLGVSTHTLDSVIDGANSKGAYGAKLSGAGGGDCMIALVSRDKRKSVEKAIEREGGTIIHVRTNAEGVRVENI